MSFNIASILKVQARTPIDVFNKRRLRVRTRHRKSFISVLISHLVWAHRDVDIMVGHINAGANNLDRASIDLLGSTLALKDFLYLDNIDLE